MKRYKIGEKIEEGFEFDNRSFTYGDRIVATEDIIINSMFFEDVVVSKGSKGVIKGLDIERRTSIKIIDDKPVPIVFRGHKVKFDMFDDIEFFHDNFAAEVEPYKLEKID